MKRMLTNRINKIKKLYDLAIKNEITFIEINYAEEKRNYMDLLRITQLDLKIFEYEGLLKITADSSSRAIVEITGKLIELMEKEKC